MKIELEVEELRKVLESFEQEFSKSCPVERWVIENHNHHFAGLYKYLKSKLDNAYPKPGEVWEDEGKIKSYAVGIVPLDFLSNDKDFCLLCINHNSICSLHKLNGEHEYDSRYNLIKKVSDA